MADRRRVVWAPRAQEDLLDIWHYFERVGSAEVADGILLDLDRTAERLEQHPLMGRSRDELAPELRSVLANPHIVFYRVSDQAIEIARVLHQRRDLATIFASEPEQGREP
jgi:toxin ParE1/3/4